MVVINRKMLGTACLAIATFLNPFGFDILVYKLTQLTNDYWHTMYALYASAVLFFGFSYLDQNSDRLSAAIIDNTEPTFENIAEGKYSVSRDLFFYIKHSHIGVIPGLEEYMKEWTRHWDEDGILADAGMIPMPEEEIKEMINRIETLEKLTVEDLQ